MHEWKVCLNISLWGQEILANPAMKPRVQETKKILLMPPALHDIETINEEMCAMNADPCLYSVICLVRCYHALFLSINS